MNKKIIAFLFATLLLIGGVVSLIADKINILPIINTLMGNNEITQFSTQDPPPNPCGGGNGGGGDPG